MSKVVPTPITEEMEKAYIDYAMSVIVSRALPDVRDGLKPVQRRIIYAMSEQGNSHDKPFVKCAAVVGEVLKKYHPHGDATTYEALVRMGQDFSLRYPLIDSQGNYGSLDGDPPAAMRYTETRLSKIAQELLEDIDKETVEFQDNYSGGIKEPRLLPSRIPNLLLNGATGIAVGMATQIPPHNLGEVIDALVFLLKNPALGIVEGQGKKIEEVRNNLKTFTLKPLHEYLPPEKEATFLPFESGVTPEKLLDFIKGPDFPTGGVIFDRKEIGRVYATGRGRIVMAGEAQIEEGQGRTKIVISSIPFQVNKATLVTKIAELVRTKKIAEITDVRDESDRRGLSIVIELKKGSSPKKILNKLYKDTDLQTTFNANMVALVKGEPQTLTLKRILQEFIAHRQEVVVRRSLYLLREARGKKHLLQGLKIAFDHLDQVIATIKKSQTIESAKNNLIEKFGLTPPQAEAILAMRLRRLAALERKKIEDELSSIAESIEAFEQLVYSRKNILAEIERELLEIKASYADERKTKVVPEVFQEFEEEDLIADEPVLVTLTREGYIKRMGQATFKTQKRGGKGVVGMETKEGDVIDQMLTSRTHDRILFFTNQGRVYQLRVWEIPEGVRVSRGKAIVNLLTMRGGEKVAAVLAYKNINPRENQKKYVFLATREGVVKKTPLSAFEKIRSNGLTAISLKRGDELSFARLTSGADEIILTTSLGQAIRFKETDVRSTGRGSLGVKGIALRRKDRVVGAEIIRAKSEAGELLVVTEKGRGKRTALANYPTRKRGGLGVKTVRVTPKTGPVVSVKLVEPGEEESLIMVSKGGQVVKMPLKSVPRLARITQGVILMRFAERADGVAVITCLRPA